MFLIITSLLLFEQFRAQASMSGIRKEKQGNDTLEMLQGLWNFHHLSIRSKTSIKSDNWFFNTLEVRTDTFGIVYVNPGGISTGEGYLEGKIVHKNNFIFHLISGDCGTNPDTLSCRDMSIHKLSKNQLILMQPGQNANSYFKNEKGLCDVLFVFNRKLN